MLRFPGLQRHTRPVAFLLLVAVCWLLAAAAVAQEAPGAIKGIIRDAETGEKLDYANVLLKGTNRGTMSLGGGVFYFQNLRPGKYTVQVLYLGYAPEERTVEVRSGETVTLRFDMKVVIVETVQAISVEGARYMVEVKNAASEQKIGADRLQKYAIDSVEQAVAKQAGVQMRDGQLYVRGGRSGEVSMRIDGVPVDNVAGGGALSVSSLAVEAVKTVTGGMDPEYGSAMSGIINVTTRTGPDDHFEGRMRYMTDDFGRQDKTYTNFDRLEFGFGGPTPIDKLTYFFAGDMSFTDTENYSVANRPEYRVNLGNATLFQFRRRQSNAVKGSTKWKYDFNQNIRLTAEYTINWSSRESYAPNWSVSGYAKRVVYMPLVVQAPNNEWLVTNQFIPVYYGPWYESMNARARPGVVLESRGAGLVRRTAPLIQVRGIDNRLYTVVAEPAYDGFRYPNSAYSTAQEDSSYTWFNSADRRGTNEHIGSNLNVILRHNLTEDTFYTLSLGLLKNEARFSVNDKMPWEYNHGGVWSPGLFSGQNLLYLLGTDYYTDPDSPLFVTTSDYPLYNENYVTTYTAIFKLTSSRWPGHLVKTGLEFHYNDIENYTLSYPAVERRNRNTGEYSLGNNRNVYKSTNPEVSWFIQDRWEYEGMVMTYGFRWDLFSPGSAARILINNPDVNHNVIKYKQQFSPRLAFAFPITERDGFNFSYGRFIQFPTRDLLFASQDAIGNSGVLGNPNLKAETTIGYQAGVKHQFTDYLAGSVAIYSRDIYDLIAATTVTDPETGNILARYINKAYASARGVEVTLNKRMSHNFAMDLAYTYSFADGVASSQTFGSNPEGLEFLPSQELPLDWDQRHKLDLSFLLSKPGSWSGSVSFSYGSGFPWTPVDRFARKQDPLLENSRRLPATYQLDIQAERPVNFYGQKLTIYLQGFNLINQDMVRAPSAGIFPGMNNAAAAYTSFLTETGKYGGALLQDANGDSYNEFIPINDPRVFMNHRLFRVGIGWQF